MTYYQFDTIIIGAGLGGLVAGATLTKKGHRVLLLEQHYVAGGCATTFKRKDYIMEVGLHEMDGLYEKDIKKDIFEYLEIDKNINLIKVPEVFRLKSEKLDFTLPHGKKASYDKLVSYFPNEAKNIQRFLTFMDNILTELPQFPLEKWKQTITLPIMPLKFPNIVRASRKSLGAWLDYYFKDEDLKLLLQANLLYYHDDPYSMSMIYFAAAQTSYINGGGYFIKGGSQKLSDYLVSIINNNGGQVVLGKTVKEVIIEEGKAKGVLYHDKYQNSSENRVYAENIISNAAIPVLEKMLPNKEALKINQKVGHLKPSCSLLSIYIGFKGDIKQYGSVNYSTFFSHKEVETLKDVHKNYQGDWTKRNFVFVDYSQIDAGLAPKGKSFGVICCADYIQDWESLSSDAYKAKKEEVASIFIQRLDQKFPGIKNEIEHYEVATSKTIRSYINSPNGTPYGYAQIKGQSGRNRTPLKSPIPNLYFAGSWSFPGGGFTGAIISGYLCATQIQDQPNVVSKDQNEPSLDTENKVTLIEKKLIAEDTVELSFTKPVSFQYNAGQYLILDLLTPKYTNLDISHRPLSIVSHPSEENIRLAMRYSDSSFKKSIKEMDLNTVCKIYGPIGSFSTQNATKGISFIVAGIGITPILPLLKELENQHYSNPVYLFYSNKNEVSTAYHHELQEVQLENFHYVPVFTETEERISAITLFSHLQQWDNFQYYIVGNSSFNKGMKEMLLSNPSINNEDILVDDFG
ncbi:FAD-dependent oxidoreductase [Flammeovirga sp. SubArs3]|uniref:FAD-dependent oxidoreductase n=1 Tax=Flammeovirga sp. SubArs3 TaxID=2995316 RepID=UPI00248AC685|nr:FAD-dependent oxidoreductase [Flammeovirga sp. SubArs3]